MGLLKLIEQIDGPLIDLAPNPILLRRTLRQSSSGRWRSLKLGIVSGLSMTLRQTTHFAVSPSLLGTDEGVAE